MVVSQNPESRFRTHDIEMLQASEHEPCYWCFPDGIGDESAEGAILIGGTEQSFHSLPEEGCDENV